MGCETEHGEDLSEWTSQNEEDSIHKWLRLIDFADAQRGGCKVVDTDSTAVRPRYAHSTTCVTTGLLHCGLNK